MLLRVATTVLGYVLAVATVVGGVTTFTNPLKNPNGSDPFIVHDTGFYYLTTTTWNNVQISRATTIAGLKTAGAATVYSSSTSTRCCNVWAPEIHKVGGTWNIYFTVGNNVDLGGQRIHVLQGVAANPNGPYTYRGQLSSSNNPNAWAIDGTVLTISNANYFVFSSFSPNNLQSLYIAPMTSAFTLGAMTLLSEPTASWERVGMPVNEGPAPLYNGTKVWMAYSASYCWTSSYALGLLEWTGGNPVSPSSWIKSGPVFTSANGNFGPAHNGFFTSPDGRETWMVYHSSLSDPAKCDGSRVTMAQKLNWHTNGEPSFGSPRALTDAVPVPSGDGS